MSFSFIVWKLVEHDLIPQKSSFDQIPVRTPGARHARISEIPVHLPRG